MQLPPAIPQFGRTTGFSHSNPSIFWFSKTVFRIGLTNGYEDGITGVHLKNKKQQDRTMKQFMAGDIGPGEMGCGIELTVPKKHIVDQLFPNPLLLYIQFIALKT